MSPKGVKFVDLQRQFITLSEPIEKSVRYVMESGRYVGGEQVVKFEREFSDYLGTRFGVGVGSGSDALIIALKSLGIGKGDKVITVPFTFVSTVDAILHVSAEPIFVDIDPKTLTIDVEGLRNALVEHKDTKAIIPVHLYGSPAKMDQIMQLAMEYGVYVVEDAAQAHGALFGKKKIGSFGDISCFSFYPAKNLGGMGDGGFIATDDPQIADKIKLLREYGQREKYKHELLGWNSRLDPIQAAILSIKLKKLDAWNLKRSSIADAYRNSLGSIKEITFQSVPADVKGVYHIFAILTKRRDKLRNYLERFGIETGIHYPIPVHRQKYYLDIFGEKGDKFINTENAANTELSLPMFPELSEEELDFVVDRVISFFSTG